MGTMAHNVLLPVHSQYKYNFEQDGVGTPKNPRPP